MDHLIHDIKSKIGRMSKCSGNSKADSVAAAIRMEAEAIGRAEALWIAEPGTETLQ